MVLNLLHFKFAAYLSSQVGLDLQCPHVFMMKDYSTRSKLRFPISSQFGCICLSVMTVRLKLVHNYVQLHVHVDGVFCHYIYTCTSDICVSLCSHYKINS